MCSSTRFSWNSEAGASEFQENPEKIFLFQLEKVVDNKPMDICDMRIITIIQLEIICLYDIFTRDLLETLKG